MTKSKQINESLVVELAFETLGNALGDYLLLLELKAITKINDPPYVNELKRLLDRYAEQFDKLLYHHKTNMASDITELTRALLVDLEKNKPPIPPTKHNLHFYTLANWRKTLCITGCVANLRNGYYSS
jgi:inactivated superfamily I helicase